MDAHLVLVPGLGTLTVGGLTGGDVQGRGGKTDGTLDLEGLGASTLDQSSADGLKGGDLAGGEGDTDLVDLLYSGKNGVLAHCLFNLGTENRIRRSDADDSGRGEIGNARGPRRIPSLACKTC